MAAEVQITLFGLRGGHASRTRLTERVSPDATVWDILLRLREAARPDERLATLDPEALLVLVNGQPINYLDGWETCVSPGDEITYMIKASGG